MKKLAEDEGSETFRVRAQRPLLEWFKGMTAEERGAALARLMAGNQDTSEVREANTPRPPTAKPRMSERAAPSPAAPSRPAGEVLRWSGVELNGLSAAQAKVLGYLHSGAVLVKKEGTNHWQASWPDGRVREAGNLSVQVLKRAGLLQPV